MERALNPDLLNLALGQHDNLPSVAELSRLIAEAELSILIGNLHIEASLIETAWYLHAIASSKYALSVYGLSRQRAAFRVAGHVFDLATKLPELSLVDKLKYCFCSQVAYLRSELNPNAIAAYDQEISSRLPIVSLSSDSTLVSLCYGVALLGFDANYIYKTTKSILAEIRETVIALDVADIFTLPCGAAAGVVTATRDLMTFLVYGNWGALDNARQVLQKAVLAEPSADDQISRWVAAHLLNLLTDLEGSAIRSILPPDSPTSLLKAFVMGRPKVLTFWPPQIDLLKPSGTDDQSPLSPEVKRLFLSMPTSSGKTLIAQLIIASHLSTERTSVYYIAPTRSLCREVRVSLESRLRFLGSEIVDGLPEGDWLGEFQTSGPRVEVMTPERLSYLLRSDSARVLTEVGLFIFDEVHNIGDQDRGWTLEQDLTYLHYATSGKSQRIILMSAAVGNQAHFVQWMGKDGNMFMHRTSEWRGPRQIHAIYTTTVDWNSKVDTVTRSPKSKYPCRITYPVFGQLDVRISQTGDINSLRTTETIGDLAFKADDGYNPIRGNNGKYVKDNNKSTPFYKLVVPIITHLAKSGPVLTIECTRPGTVRMAKAIAEAQPLADHRYIKGILALVEARLGVQHPLWRVLQRGVAYHHGALPSEIRIAIEEAVTNGYIKHLVATTTMTEGVNLPVKSVVIASLGSHGEDGYTAFITGSKLINAIGRAGRAAKETEGIIVLALQSRPTSVDFERLRPKDGEMQVISMLATKRALDELAVCEETVRADEDALFQNVDNTVSNFISFIWFIASELEKINIESLTLGQVSKVLDHTLGWRQLSAEYQEQWLELADLIIDRYKATNESLRRRWAAAGTSVSSASRIEIVAQSLAHSAKTNRIPDDPTGLIKFILAEGRLEQLLALPEAPKRLVYNQRAGNRTAVDISVEELLADWVQGTELMNIADKHLALVMDTDFRFEQLCDFLNEYFEVFFPWIIGTVVSWANWYLMEDGLIGLFPRTLPAHVRWGVGTAPAVELMTKGITSRTLATRIANCWLRTNPQQDVMTWLRHLSVSQWQELFSASITELRLLLEFCRDQKGGVAAQLLINGKASIAVDANLADLPTSEASLSSLEDDEISSLAIWVNGKIVGKVASRDQADVQAIVSSGLDYSAVFSVNSGVGTLEMELTDPQG